MSGSATDSHRYIHYSYSYSTFNNNTQTDRVSESSSRPKWLQQGLLIEIFVEDILRGGFS